MKNLEQEVLESIQDIKNYISNANNSLSEEQLKILFIASLLEEETKNAN